MPTVIVSHKVGNFDTWLKGHAERKELFGQVTSGFKTFQDANDPNSISMVMEVTDMDAFGKLVQDPKLNEAKQRHTVIDPILVSMQVPT